MADEFQSGICNGNWWNSTKFTASSTCSTAISDGVSFGWSGEFAEVKARSRPETISVCDSLIVSEDAQKTQVSDSGSGALIDSTLQMIGYGLPSPLIDWNQDLLQSSGRSEYNFHSMQREDLPAKSNFLQESSIRSSQVQQDWNPRNFLGGVEESIVPTFKQIHESFNTDDSCLNSYGSSSLMQGFYDPDIESRQSMKFQSSVASAMDSSQVSNSWSKFPQFLKNSTIRQQNDSQLHFIDNTPFWNASGTITNDLRPSFLPSSNLPVVNRSFVEKPNSNNVTNKVNTQARVSTKKISNELTLKRPRVETPSPLPTFKVRKEKLGDRITVLQQLVSPFGKTDTASVLFEAIETIKILHDQINVLSAPYMKNGGPKQHPQNAEKFQDWGLQKHDLKSRGLCLVPISSTFPVTNEPGADFWTPTFGGTFR